MIHQVSAAVRASTPKSEFHPGKQSLRIQFVRLTPEGETSFGPAERLIVEAENEEQLYQRLGEQVVLTVFGPEVQVVSKMPNLIVDLFGKTRRVYMEGAPSLDAPGQPYLKLSIEHYAPTVWPQYVGHYA